MRRIKHIGVAVAMLVASLAFTGVASAGYFVFTKGDDLWVARDDGSQPSMIMTAQSVKVPAFGFAELIKPAVLPGGDAVAVESRNSDTSRVYTFEAGKVTLAGAGAANSVVASWSSAPDVTSDRRVLFEAGAVAIVGGCGLYGCGWDGAALGGFRWAGIDGSPGGDVIAGCTDATNPNANPVNPGLVAHTGCTELVKDPSKPYDWGTTVWEVLSTDGTSATLMTWDDKKQLDVGWSPDGSRIVVAEQGEDPGLWTYPVRAQGWPITEDLPGATYALALAADDSTSPVFVGTDRIAFVAGGDIWTIPATLSGGSFPASATRVTSLGGITGVAWTSAASFRTTAQAAPQPQPQPTPKPALTVTGLRVAPSHFRALGRGASVVKKGGAKVTFKLSEAAKVTFTIARKTTGRSVRGKCVKATRSNRRAKRCTRYVAVKGSFTKAGVKGANALRFSGRLRGKRLASGSYRLTATAKASDGRSASRTAPFRITRR